MVMIAMSVSMIKAVTIAINVSFEASMVMIAMMVSMTSVVTIALNVSFETSTVIIAMNAGFNGQYSHNSQDSHNGHYKFFCSITS